MIDPKFQLHLHGEQPDLFLICACGSEELIGSPIDIEVLDLARAAHIAFHQEATEE